MLLIFLSSRAFSLLSGSFGSLRFFSEGTSPARGGRWPIGAPRIGCARVAPDDPLPLPVCASAGLPIRASTAIVVIRLRILLLPTSTTREQPKPSADAPEFRWRCSCGDPVPHSPAPYAHPPWWRAAIRPPPPAPRRSPASPRSRWRGCPDRPAAPALPCSARYPAR